jgi:hypothetical protein
MHAPRFVEEAALSAEGFETLDALVDFLHLQHGGHVERRPGAEPPAPAAYHTNREPTLWRTKNRPEMNSARDFASVVASLSIPWVVSEYRHDQAVAPRRPRRQKSFFLADHQGIPNSRHSTNRIEEHLTLALYAAHSRGGRLVRPTGDRLRLINYQIPLKERQADPIGKIDAVGLLDDGTPCVIEMKAPTRRNPRGDSPLRALFEALSYAAVIEANRVDFDKELRLRHPDGAVEVPLVLLLLGPASWWDAWRTCNDAGEWVPPFNDLCRGLARDLGLIIACAALDRLDPADPSQLKPGLNRTEPRLIAIPQLVDVEGLPALPIPGKGPATEDSYLGSLIGTMRAYARQRFTPERCQVGPEHLRRPPLFPEEHAVDNVISAPDRDVASRVASALPAPKRHRYFASMRSSQALTQSVFAGLAESGRLQALETIAAECGRPAFGTGLESFQLTLEKEVTWLGEPRPTSVDAWLESADRRVAIECKLAETEFGRCSRATLTRDDPRYCDGSHRHQLGRKERCSLTEMGIDYWRHIPLILDWDAHSDGHPCPLDWTYQLVRNVLAAVVWPDRSVDTTRGHALVVYDARNPAFAPRGAAHDALNAITAALRTPGLLRIVAWQVIAGRIANVPDLSWLADGLAEKYGCHG